MCGDDPSSKSEKPRSHTDNRRSTGGTERETCRQGKGRRGGGQSALSNDARRVKRIDLQPSQPASCARGWHADGLEKQDRPSPPTSFSPLPLALGRRRNHEISGQPARVLMVGPGHSHPRLAGSGRSTDRWARVLCKFTGSDRMSHVRVQQGRFFQGLVLYRS